jgi:cleavage and polyadenylation specificity factor subunit 1
MSYPLYKTLHPPTGVEECCTGSIFGDNEINLIVAKTSLLQIFRIKRAASHLRDTATAIVGTPKLELLVEKSMHGNIESVGVVRLPGSKRDSIVLSYKDAKVILKQQMLFIYLIYIFNVKTFQFAYLIWIDFYY